MNTKLNPKTPTLTGTYAVILDNGKETKLYASNDYDQAVAALTARRKKDHNAILFLKNTVNGIIYGM